MPRQPRINIADGVYHVTNRGLEQRAIVRDDKDRRDWKRLFARVAVRCRWRVFAWALLDNHFHIFLRTPSANLSIGMRDFESGYVSVFNRRHARTGPLFQARFHAVLVEFEQHAAEIGRYVHLNSWRAGLAGHPAEETWSSYRCYLDPRNAPNWLDWRTVLSEFGNTEAAARIAYRRFVESGMQGEPRDPFVDVVDAWLLGSQAFVDEWRKSVIDSLPATIEFEDIIEGVARHCDCQIASIRERGRHANIERELAIMLIRELRNDSLAEVAQYFGNVSRSAITEAAKRARRREEHDPEFREIARSIRDKLT